MYKLRCFWASNVFFWTEKQFFIFSTLHLCLLSMCIQSATPTAADVHWMSATKHSYYYFLGLTWHQSLIKHTIYFYLYYLCSGDNKIIWLLLSNSLKLIIGQYFRQSKIQSIINKREWIHSKNKLKLICQLKLNILLQWHWKLFSFKCEIVMNVCRITIQWFLTDEYQVTHLKPLGEKKNIHSLLCRFFNKQVFFLLQGFRCPKLYVWWSL